MSATLVSFPLGKKFRVKEVVLSPFWKRKLAFTGIRRGNSAIVTEKFSDGCLMISCHCGKKVVVDSGVASGIIVSC